MGTPENENSPGREVQMAQPMNSPEARAKALAEAANKTEDQKKQLLLGKSPSVPADQMGWQHYLTQRLTAWNYNTPDANGISQADVDWAHWEKHLEDQAALAQKEEAARAALAANTRENRDKFLGSALDDTMRGQ